MHRLLVIVQDLVRFKLRQLLCYILLYITLQYVSIYIHIYFNCSCIYIKCIHCIRNVPKASDAPQLLLLLMLVRVETSRLHAPACTRLRVRVKSTAAQIMKSSKIMYLLLGKVSSTCMSANALRAVALLSKERKGTAAVTAANCADMSISVNLTIDY